MSWWQIVLQYAPAILGALGGLFHGSQAAANNASAAALKQAQAVSAPVAK